jgi:hypothetical protein
LKEVVMSHQVVYEPAVENPPRAIEVDPESPLPVEGIRPSGPAAAVVLAAGLASFTLGLLSVLTAASASVSTAFTLSDRVGDISGLTTAATVVFFSSWVLLAIAWRRAEPPLMRVAAAAAVLVALGVLGTFPPFFNTFGG